MDLKDKVDRRMFIRSAALTSAALVAGAPFLSMGAEKKRARKAGVEEVSPVEDLMREHGALNRILLIYDEALRRLQAKEDFKPALVKRSATLIHDFIENYHEKLEEEHLFPRLKRAHRLPETVDTLLAQHQAGRKLTRTIIALSSNEHLKNGSDLAALRSALTAFIRMYRPHEAREDTVVFPEFKKVVTPAEYDRMGEQFEALEHKLFGKEGFEGIVVKVSAIEEELGIYKLSQFTPKLEAALAPRHRASL